MLTSEISLSVFNALITSGKLDLKSETPIGLGKKSAKYLRLFDDAFQKAYKENKPKPKPAIQASY